MKKIYALALTAMLSVPILAQAGSGPAKAEQADNLFEYVITSPAEDSESFWEIKIQFPNAASVEYIPAYDKRNEYISYFKNSEKFQVASWATPFLSGNTLGLDPGFSQAGSVDDRWEVILQPGLFNLLDAEENVLGTNELMNIVVTEGLAQSNVDFSYTCEPASPEGELMLPELSSATFTFSALENVTVNADAATVTLGGTAVDKSLYSIAAAGNKVTVTFNPALTTTEDAALAIAFPEGSLTGTKGADSDTNKAPVEVSYKLVPPVAHDLTINFYQPIPNENGEIELKKFDSMLFFACDNTDTKAVGGDTPNFTLKEVNGDYESSVKLAFIGGMASDKSTYYAQFPKPVYNGEYTLTLAKEAFGDSRWRNDHSMGHTNDEVVLKFNLTGGEDRPVIPDTPEIKLSEVYTATEALAVKGVPSDNEIYWWANIIETDRYPGDAEMFESAINFFKLGAETFNMDWLTVYQMTAKQGEYTWGFNDLLPQTKYTVYAFGLDEKGELYMPMTKIEVRTADPIVSDNTFTLEVVSVEAGSTQESKNVTVKVTPTNNDPYAVVLVDKMVTDQYDLNDEAGNKNCLRQALRPLVNENAIFTGEKTIVYENVKIDAVMQAAVFGFQGYETTKATVADFNTIDENFEAVTVQAYDPTISGASATVYSFDMVRPYVMGVISKATAEEIGGVENVHEQYNVPSWEAAGMGYYDWRYFAQQALKRQPVDGTLAEVANISSLKWNTEYYLYGYLMDEGGYRTSPVFFDEFTTAPCNESDNTFKLTMMGITSNAPLSPDTYTAEMTITPSDKTAPYALYYGETRDFEKYLEEDRVDDWMYDVFMSRRVKKTYTDELNFEYGAVYNDGNYILIVAGFDEAPNTKPTWMLFNKDGVYKDSWTNVGVESVNRSGLRIHAVGHDIYVDGEFTDAAVYTTDGMSVGSFKGNVCRVDGSGCYIVRVQTENGTETRKIAVK